MSGQLALDMEIDVAPPAVSDDMRRYWAIMMHLQEHVAPDPFYLQLLLAYYRMVDHAERTWDEESDEDVRTVVCMGSYWAALLRTTYLHYIHRPGASGFVLWNAVVQVFILRGVWKPALEGLTKTQRFKDMAARTHAPDWVALGLVGCDGWGELHKRLDAWCVRHEAACEEEDTQ